MFGFDRFLAMVNAFRRSGVSDWILQRLSAVVILVYSITILSVLVPSTNFHDWYAFMTQFWMRLYSTIVLLSIIVHAWIGLWAVLTDYVTVRTLGSRGDPLRTTLFFVTSFLLLVYLIWGFSIVWGMS